MRYLKIFFKCLFWSCLLFIVGSLLLVLGLRWVDPPGSAFTFAYNLQHESEADMRWVDLERISPWLQVSVIASEDQKFPSHWGFDLASIQKALNENRKRTRGASTITQQVAKNLFLWNGRSYLRKAVEAWFTLLIEICWPKERTLEIYLNVAEFGPGVYGAEAAARRYYNTAAAYLSPWQAGVMAAVLPNPKRMSVARPSEYVQTRAYEIYNQVQMLGGTTFLNALH